jgi:hypothetical protein
MSSLGQSIRILLADGTVTGIRHAEVVNWTIQAIACPRSRVGELAAWDEASRPGAYLLFGQNEEDGGAAVYIGEAENVRDRLQDHLAKKEFWNEVILFTSKDQNLTKAHVRYLESRLVSIARGTKRYSVNNATEPQPALLPRGDRDAMESFLNQVRVLLGVLGHKLLEPITAAVTPSPSKPTTTPPAVEAQGSLAGTEIFLQTKNLKARALMTDEGIVIRAGSQASMKLTDSIGGTYKRLRALLESKNVLKSEGDVMVFAEDYLFTSPTAAAVTVLGYAFNGRDGWKTSEGISINQLEAAASGTE